MDILALFNLLACGIATGIGAMAAAGGALSPTRSRLARLNFAAVAAVGFPLSLFALAACFHFATGV